MQEQIGNGNSKDGCKRNERNEECLGVHITRLDTAKKRINEWKKHQQNSPKLKCKETKKKNT